MKKIIYTAFTKGYDTLKDPTIITPGWKYVCYTNDTGVKSDIWEVVYYDFQSVKDVRRLKILQLFDYDISIWCDASTQINCDLNIFLKTYHKGDFTLMDHPSRTCIYQEAETCIRLKKDLPFIIQEQMDNYRSIGYPKDNGMVATGILIRNKCRSVDRLCELWWKQVERYSKRDQLSFNFVAHYEKFKFNLISFNILKTDFILNRHSK